MRATSSTDPRDRLLSVPFVLAFVANFLTALSAHMYLHFPGFLLELGAGEVRIGIIMGSMSAAGIVVRPVLGTWMDTRGRRLIAIVGACCMIAACLSYLTVHSISPWLYVVRVLHGVAIAALFSSLFTIAADVAPVDRRAGAIALFGISGLLPLAVGGLVGDMILAYSSYQTLFLSTAGASILCLFVVLPIRDTRPRRGGDSKSRGFLQAITARNLRPVWFVGFGFALCVAACFTFLKTYVLHTGVGTVGLFFASYAMAAVAIRIGTSRLLDRITPKQALVPSLAATCAGLFVLAVAHHPALLLLSGVLCGLGHGYAFPTIAAVVVQRASSSNRGAAISIFTAIFDVGFLAGGPLFGLLIRLSSYPTMFVVAAVLLVVMTVVFLQWDRAY